MKKALITLAAIFSIIQANAQYVNIPDAAFASYLTSKYPSAMSGSMMDTTNTEIVNETYFNCLTRSISNLYGIQFFDKLKHLVCAHNDLTSLPNLPNTLDTLECYVNKITSISSLPNSLRVLSCSQNSLTSLPKLPDSLRVLDLWQNNLTSLPILPDSLMFLECSYNYLTSLPNIPISLKQLNCTYNPNLFCLPPVFQDKIEKLM